MHDANNSRVLYGGRVSIRRLARTAPLPAKEIARHLDLSLRDVSAELTAVPDPAVQVTGRDDLWRHAAAEDHESPPKVLARLATDPLALVRGAVARHPATPIPVLRRLCADPFPSVRSAAARNESCPPGALRRLAVDPHPDVRIAVAHNESCPPGALRRLAVDPHSDVRITVAHNDSCPADVLRRLAVDPHPDVRIAVAHNESCPPGALRRLAVDPHSDVRFTVAHNDSCPADVLRRLAVDPHPDVRIAVAHNESCPPGALRRLAGVSPLSILTPMFVSPLPTTTPAQRTFCAVSRLIPTLVCSWPQRPTRDTRSLGPGHEEAGCDLPGGADPVAGTGGDSERRACRGPSPAAVEHAVVENRCDGAVASG